jgi:hypothetical protein
VPSAAALNANGQQVAGPRSPWPNATSRASSAKGLVTRILRPGYTKLGLMSCVQLAQEAARHVGSTNVKKENDAE